MSQPTCLLLDQPTYAFASTDRNLVSQVALPVFPLRNEDGGSVPHSHDGEKSIPSLLPLNQGRAQS